MHTSIYLYFIPFFLALYGALSGEQKGHRYSQVMFWVILAYMALLGGGRWQVGWDWQGYNTFFSLIQLSGLHGIFGSGYIAQSSGLRFESGYYALSYIVKLLGGTNVAVFWIASIFNILALNRLIKAVPSNRCFALFFYICFCFIFLNFAMIRQSMAVGFAYLACREQIEGGKLIKALALMLAGALFHISALMYLPVLFVPELGGRRAKLILGGSALMFIFTFAFKIDMNAALVGFVCKTLGWDFFSKYYAYVNVPYIPSWRTYVLIAFNFPLALYFVLRPASDPKLKRLATLTFNATLLMVLMVVFFPSNPSIWRRLLFLAAPLQGIWLASQLLTAQRREKFWIYGTTVVYGGSSYAYTVLSSVALLSPYGSVFGRFFK